MMGDTHELGHGSEGTRQPSQPWAPTEPPQPDDDEAHHHARRKAQRLLTLSSRGGEGRQNLQPEAVVCRYITKMNFVDFRSQLREESKI